MGKVLKVGWTVGVTVGWAVGWTLDGHWVDGIKNSGTGRDGHTRATVSSQKLKISCNKIKLWEFSL